MLAKRWKTSGKSPENFPWIFSSGILEIQKKFGIILLLSTWVRFSKITLVKQYDWMRILPFTMNHTWKQIQHIWLSSVTLLLDYGIKTETTFLDLESRSVVNVLLKLMIVKMKYRQHFLMEKARINVWSVHNAPSKTRS